jgi:hypothetical protein
MGALALEIAHELIEAFLVLSFAQARQVRVNRRHGRAFVAEIDLDLTEVLALFQEVRGVRMS